MNFAAVGSSRNFGSGSSAPGEVARVDRDAGGGVVVAPVDDPFEEGAQQPEPMRIVVGDQLAVALPGARCDPSLVGLDVAALDAGDR